MTLVFDNETPQTSVRYAFSLLSRGVKQVSLACPFFSYPTIINDLVANGVHVRLLVRLGPSTTPKALAEVFQHEQVLVRFVTSRRFHTKLYVFGELAALVGSANLTESGVQRNREACLRVGAGTGEFDHVAGLFRDYWARALVLDEPKLRRYTDLWN